MVTADRDSTLNCPLTAAALAEQVASLRSVGGVYEYVAAWVEYDNRPERGALADTQLDALARPGAVRVVPTEGEHHEPRPVLATPLGAPACHHSGPDRDDQRPAVGRSSRAHDG